MQPCFVTFAVFLDGLFEGSDVSKRAQEKNDDISLIFYRRNLQKKPQGSAWVRAKGAKVVLVVVHLLGKIGKSSAKSSIYVVGAT